MTRKPKVVKGYKAFSIHRDSNLKKVLVCRDYKFKEGRTEIHKGEVKLCRSGFHFCTKLVDVFKYYNLDQFLSGNVAVYEVEATGVTRRKNDCTKKAARTLTPIRQIDPKEIKDAFPLKVRREIYVKVTNSSIAHNKFRPVIVGVVEKNQTKRVFHSWADSQISGPSKPFTEGQIGKTYKVYANIHYPNIKMAIEMAATRSTNKSASKPIFRAKMQITGRPKLAIL